MSEIQRYRFVVEHSPKDDSFRRAYAAPWEGSQEPDNDWVTFADHTRVVAEQVAAAVAAERKRLIDAYAKSIAARNEYATLLGEEINELFGYAYSHGWRSTRTEAGKALRARIAEADAAVQQIKEALK